ncbi:MAG: chromate transporter [Armatimonadota bacterium]|nr:chromate transporter [Armatimonadota bacterium]
MDQPTERADTEEVPPSERPRVGLGRIFAVFLLIGAIGFGGGMAVIAIIEREVVRKRRWVPLEEFTHGIAFGQILGPFAVNTSTFIGYYLRGLAGAAAAVLGFLLPSFLMVVALSAAYFRWHEIPALQSALNGIAPVVIALIFSAALNIGRPKIRDGLSAGVALAAMLVALLLKANVVLILSAAAGYGLVRSYVETRRAPGEGEG